MSSNSDSSSLSSKIDLDYLSKASNRSNSVLSPNHLLEPWNSKANRRKYLEERQKKILNISKQKDLAFSGWKNALQPWNEHICKKWISWGHILQHWRIAQRKKYAKEYRLSLRGCTHKEYLKELTQIYKRFYKLNLYENTQIPYWLAAMVYAKLFLSRSIDWNIIDKKHNTNKNLLISRETFATRTQRLTDDAEASTIPEVPPVDMTPSQNEDGLTVTKELRNFDQIKGKGKRPLNPMEGDEDEPMENYFRRLRRGPRVSETGDNEDTASQEVVSPAHISQHDMYRDVFGSPPDETAPTPHQPLHIAESSKVALDEANLTNISKLLAPASKDHPDDQIIVSAYLKGENEALNLQNRTLQKELELLCNKHKNEVDNITAELNKTNEEIMTLQAQFSRVKHDLQKQNEENTILQVMIPRLKDDFQREETEKRILREKMEELRKTNEDSMVLQAQIPRLKEDLRKEEFEKRILREKMEDLTKQNHKIQNDHNQSILDIQILNKQIEEIKAKNQSEIQKLKEEMEKIKNEKRLIVQLDEGQFGKIEDLISQKIQGSNVAK